jgi:hypothetical protein
MGVMNEEYLEKVRQDTHRGLRGCFDRKLATGGPPFGYRTIPIVTGQDAHGHPLTQGYRLEVNPELAPVVVRLFEGYARQGHGLRTLAHRLNAEGIAPPRPRSERGRAASWSPTAIREMLRNPIYRGERVWNRSSWVKDHETGKRRRFERFESEWVRQQEESWRIVPDELWQAAQEARGLRSAPHLRTADGRIVRSALGIGAHRRRLLAGFLECGECGGSFHALKGGPSWGCSWHRDRGTCANDRLISAPVLERLVLNAVEDAIDDEIAEHALRIALDDLRQRIEASEPKALEAERVGIERRIDVALDLAIELGDSSSVKDRLRALKIDRERVVRALARTRATLPTVEELLPGLFAKLKEVRETLRADVALGRLALGGLLGDRRLRANRDGSVEGVATVGPGALAAPAGPRDSVVAGGCYTPVAVLPVALRLSVAAQLSA